MFTLQTRAFINTNNGESDEERHEAFGFFLTGPVLHRGWLRFFSACSVSSYNSVLTCGVGSNTGGTVLFLLGSSQGATSVHCGLFSYSCASLTLVLFSQTKDFY